jgi:peroxiredoxin Q/BCP
MSTLTPGQPAPAFEAVDQHGHTVRLSDFAGHKLVLFFYPQDDTPNCTKEACNLRDHHGALLQAGFKVVGVSQDDTTSHAAFAAKYNLPYPLLADPSHEILNAYGVWGEKNMYGKIVMGTRRYTFVIDESGIIRHVFKKVTTDAHAEQILKLKLK